MTKRKVVELIVLNEDAKKLATVEFVDRPTPKALREVILLTLREAGLKAARAVTRDTHVDDMKLIIEVHVDKVEYDATDVPMASIGGPYSSKDGVVSEPDWSSYNGYWLQRTVRKMLDEAFRVWDR